MIAVTGATGHIGVNLVRALAMAGRPVRMLARRPPPEGLFDGLDVQFQHMDLLDTATVQAGIEGSELIYHLAGLISISGDPGGQIEAVNVQGTQHVAEAALAAGVRRMIHLSSIQAFDVLAEGPMLDESTPRASLDAPAYDRSKADSEEVIRRLVPQGLEAIILNPTAVVGPIDHRPSRLGQALISLRNGSVPSLLSGQINIVDVRDVVSSAIAAETHGKIGESYILGGHQMTLPKFMRMAAGICGVESPGFVCPMWLARASAPFAQGLAKLRKREPLYTSEALRALRAHPNISHAKAAADLGHAPRPAEETIRDTYTSFKALAL